MAAVIAPMLVVFAPVAAHAASESACKASPSNANCTGAVLHYQDGICWDSNAYVVNNDYSNTWTDPVTGWSYTTVLFYSPDCKTNWADTIVAYADPNNTGYFATKVRRYAGTDGGYVMEHSAFVSAAPGTYGARAVSPMVYSPNNPAQACGSTTGDDNMSCGPQY